MLPKTKHLLLVVGCFILIGLVGAIKYPLVFKYADTLTNVEKPKISEFVDIASDVGQSERQQLNALVASIPFVSPNRQIYTVSYEDKYRRTILEGDGNCSNHITAVSWYLLNKLNTDNFNIVHFLPQESFLRGYGHTVIDFGGIYDVFEGGKWRDQKGNEVSLQDILTVNPQIAMKQFRMMNLNSNKKEKSNTYVGELMDINFIGITPADSFNEYIKFISSIYVPFSNRKLEKYFYDALALYVGKLPSVYTPTDLKYAYGQYDYVIKLAQLWLFVVRVLPFLMVLFVLKKVLILTSGKNK